MKPCISALALLIASSDFLSAESVREVVCREAPSMRELGERARRLGNEMYPRILTLLVEDGIKPPSKFDVIFKEHVDFDDVARTKGTKIYLSSFWLQEGATPWTKRGPKNFDAVFVHEMAHVAQQYIDSKVPSYWSEGVADYVRFKLGYTNTWNVAKCSAEFPHYTYGYCCAGAFLLYLDAQYGPSLVRRLNTELHNGTYSSLFFQRETGKELDVLWNEFQATPAYSREADESFRLQQSLGYTNGLAAKDVDARFQSYVERQPGGTFTVEALHVFEGLIQAHQLPGFKVGEQPKVLKGEHGKLCYEPPMGTNLTQFPAFRTFYCAKIGDPATYGYNFLRKSEASPWKLDLAWRGISPRVFEYFPVQK